MNDIVQVGIHRSLATPQQLTLWLTATHHILLQIEMKTLRKTEILTLLNRYVDNAGLIHRQKNQPKRNHQSQNSDQNYNLLIFKHRTDQKPCLEILQNDSTI